MKCDEYFSYARQQHVQLVKECSGLRERLQTRYIFNTCIMKVGDRCTYIEHQHERTVQGSVHVTNFTVKKLSCTLIVEVYECIHFGSLPWMMLKRRALKTLSKSPHHSANGLSASVHRPLRKYCAASLMIMPMFAEPGFTRGVDIGSSANGVFPVTPSSRTSGRSSIASIASDTFKPAFVIISSSAAILSPLSTSSHMKKRRTHILPFRACSVVKGWGKRHTVVITPLFSS